MTTTFPLLTVEFINNNIGKEITWFAPAYKGNFPSKGICKLLGIEDDHPIVEHIKGDDLSLARAEDGGFAYSDSGRHVKVGNAFDLYNVSYTVELIGRMNISIIVPAGSDPTECAKKRTTATEFQLEHIV